MPATAGRVRMPANNRVHSSAALQTHGIWQSAIGYDPYAPVTNKPDESATEKEKENAYASFQGLLTLARITGTNSNEMRGACKKCGRVGHLTYQCRNFLTLKNHAKLDDDSALQAATNVLDKIKKASGVEKEECGSEEDEELSSTSDSDVDPVIERIIAERLGKSLSKKSEEEEEEGKRKKTRHGHKKMPSGHHHHHHRKRRSDSDSDDDDDGLESDRRRRRRRRHHRSSRRARDSDTDTDSASESLDGHRRRSNKHRKRRRRHGHRERRSVLSSESATTASSSDEDQRSETRENKKHKEERR